MATESLDEQIERVGSAALDATESFLSRLFASIEVWLGKIEK